MKRTLLLLFTFVVATMSLDDNYMDKLATMLTLDREEVIICVNKTNVTVENMMRFDEITDDNLQTDFDDTALKVGCLFACLYQKADIMVGANLKVDKIKESTNAKFIGPERKKIILLKMFDTCADLVKNKTNECEVAVKFMMCLVQEMHRIIVENNANNNE